MLLTKKDLVFNAIVYESKLMGFTCTCETFSVLSLTLDHYFLVWVRIGQENHNESDENENSRSRLAKIQPDSMEEKTDVLTLSSKKFALSRILNFHLKSCEHIHIFLNMYFILLPKNSHPPNPPNKRKVPYQRVKLLR